MSAFTVSHRIPIIRASIEYARTQLSGLSPGQTLWLSNTLNELESELHEYQVSSSKEAFHVNHQKASLTKSTADPQPEQQFPPS